jgi:predicted membrane metal-binding protein
MAVAQIQEVWAKLNANERLVGYGAIIVIIAGLVGAVSGALSYGFVTAIVVLVIYWLKYTNSTINWPAPVPTIVLIITAITAALSILVLLGAFAFFFLGLYGISIIASVVGVLIMLYGAWRDYQGASRPAV